jgi:hypothetical protein
MIKLNAQIQIIQQFFPPRIWYSQRILSSVAIISEGVHMLSLYMP